MSFIRKIPILPDLHSYFSIPVVEPVEENMASPDFHSVKQFDAYVPSVQDNHFYVDPFGFSTTPDVTPTPSIDLTTPKNVTVIKGKTAMLACVVRDVGKAAVILFYHIFEYLHQKCNVPVICEVI